MVSAQPCSFWKLWKCLFPSLFQLLEITTFLGSWPLLFSKTITRTPESSTPSFSIVLALLPFYRVSYDYIGLIQVVQDNLKILNLVISAKSFLPCTGTYEEVLGIKMWTSLGRTLYSLPCLHTKIPPHYKQGHDVVCKL